ncbi:glycosyltransferase family A protein [Desulforhopalus sp. 52FAK]
MTEQTFKPSSQVNSSAKVSVIIPCYNQGKYVLDTLDSVLTQSYQHVEVIIVNDGSDDQDTFSILNQINIQNVQILHTSNQGLAAARNNGIGKATGDFILPLDADDLIEPGYVEQAVAVLEKKTEIGIVYCRAQLFGAVDTEWLLPPYSLEEMLKDNVIFCTAMFRKSDWEEVGGYDSGMIYGWEDYDFWLSLIEKGREVYQIPEILFSYRVASDSMVRSKEKWQKVAMFKRIFERHQKLFTNNIEVWISALLEVREKYYTSKLYLDTGNGLSDDSCVSRKVDGSTYEIQFSLPQCEGLEAIRFDPVDCPVVLEIQTIILTTVQGESHDFTAYTSNCDFQLNGESFFSTDDPCIFFNLTKEELATLKTVTVRLSFKALGEEALARIVSGQHKQIQKMTRQLNDVETSGVIKAAGKACMPHKNENVLQYVKRQFKPF